MLFPACRAARPAARPAVRPWALAAMLAGALLLDAPRASAQGLDFGRSAGEDVLLGQGSAVERGRDPHRPSADRGYGGDRRTDRWREDRPRGADSAGGHHSPSPTVIVFETAPRSTYFRGTGIFANAVGGGGGGGSVLHYQSPRPAIGREPGPKIIDVASERLDRQPIGARGIAVHYSGTTKIIRLAPGYGMARSAREADKDMAALPEPVRAPAPVVAAPEAAAPIPESAPRAAPAEEPAVEAAVEPASPRTPEPLPEPAAEIPVPEAPAAATAPETPAAETPAAAAPALEPWTAEWLTDCVARHESFDATLGTYLDEGGRRRFCTGDPA